MNSSGAGLAVPSSADVSTASKPVSPQAGEDLVQRDVPVARRRPAAARARAARPAWPGPPGRRAKAIAADERLGHRLERRAGRADGAAHDVAAVGAAARPATPASRPGAGWRGRTRSPRARPRAPSPRRPRGRRGGAARRAAPARGRRTCTSVPKRVEQDGAHGARRGRHRVRHPSTPPRRTGRPAVERSLRATIRRPRARPGRAQSAPLVPRRAPSSDEPTRETETTRAPARAAPSCARRSSP